MSLPKIKGRRKIRVDYDIKLILTLRMTSQTKNKKLSPNDKIETIFCAIWNHIYHITMLSIICFVRLSPYYFIVSVVTMKSIF